MNKRVSYYKTKRGLITSLYARQKACSKRRGHPCPSYVFEAFEEWIISQPNFKYLYDQWVVSGYERRLSPSVDRIDDGKGYSLKNIRLVTWFENYMKFYTRYKNLTHKICTKCKTVFPIDNFYANRRSNGRNTYCKQCDNKNRMKNLNCKE